ncbi:hypothetical protein QYM36_017665, partial [Artemia franciscana]
IFIWLFVFVQILIAANICSAIRTQRWFSKRVSTEEEASGDSRPHPYFLRRVMRNENECAHQ